MRIAVDAMGGDYAPAEVVRGAVQAAQLLNAEIILVGDRAALDNELKNYDWPQDKIRIHHASQVIEMDEHPATALRKKKDSSIVVSTMLVKEGQADAVVSCGNTGAQMAAAIFILGRFEGIERPPIATLIPGKQGALVLLDVGANVDVKPDQLVQFAKMGRAYAQISLELDNPRVGLFSNGEEETKGNQATVAAHAELKGKPDLNFIGNIEGRDLFYGKADVVVCDGFLGNAIIKTIEGFTSLINDRLVEKLGDDVREALQEFDYTRIGGAPLLGVRGISIVCHGSSKAEAVLNGIKQAEKCVAGDLVAHLAEVQDR